MEHIEDTSVSDIEDTRASENDKEASGEELFQRFLAGDTDAFEELVSLYEDELSRFIYRIVEDYHDSKLLTIEAFGQLAVSGKKFAERSSLKTYLFTIGKNLTIRYMKTRDKHDNVSYNEIVEAIATASETPHSYMVREENNRILHETLSELKEDYRTVLTLLFFEDLSYLQAGRAMGKSEKQIKHLVYRAKAALKKKLEEKEVSHA